MQDVLIKPDDHGIYDIQINGADFDSSEGFESAIPVSYFSDSRAPAVQVQEAQRRRGWVGNILFIGTDRELGGLLWILDQARITEDTLNLARAFAKESLQWLIDDGIALNVAVNVERAGTRGVFIYTTIAVIDNPVQRYVTLWRNTDFNRVVS